MAQHFNIKDFFLTHRKQILISILLFWFVFTLLILIEDEVALRVGGFVVDPVDRLQYCIRWVLWTLLTPLIIFLSLKFPVRKKYLLADIAKHAVFALLIVALEFLIEIPIVRFISFKITGLTPSFVDYATVFILKLNIYLLLYFLILGTTYLVLYTERSNHSLLLAKEARIKSQQLQTQLAEAKLSLLKMQLEPHFLFNTHHSIISLMLYNENEKAIKMLTRLSDLLRLSLDDQQQLICLEKEIKMLKLYLDIQQVRFNENLNIAFNIEPGTLQQKVPSFIMQPLVENAIKHGISVSSRACNIKIETSVLNKELVLRVENDGSNIDFTDFHEGLGISNTRERLRQLYNSHSKFVLNNIGNEKVEALIILPIN